MKKALLLFVLFISTACSAQDSEPAAPSLANTVIEPLQEELPSPANITEPSSPTPQIMCTPLACQDGEIYYCSGDCPGGCGTTCAMVTPVAAPVQSTATTVPLPTDTQSTPPTLPAEEASGGGLEEAGEPVIIFNQTGGFAGVDLTWSIYANGLIVTPDGEELFVDPAAVDALLEIIAQAGFFELVQPKPSNICCDFFTFALAVSNGDMENVITYNDGDPNKPAGLSEAVSAVQQMLSQ